MKVETLKPHIYAAKRRKPGDEYEIKSKSDLRLFKALGRVRESIVTSPQPEYGYLTRVMEPAPVKPKRTYTRRKKVEE